MTDEQRLERLLELERAEAEHRALREWAFSAGILDDVEAEARAEAAAVMPSEQASTPQPAAPLTTGAPPRSRAEADLMTRRAAR